MAEIGFLKPILEITLQVLPPMMPRNTPLPMIAGIAVLVVGYLLTDWSTTRSSLFATVHTLLWALYTRYELLLTQHACSTSASASLS